MNSIEKDLTDRVHIYLLENGVSENNTIIVGFSGGPDSTALLLILSELKKKWAFHIKAAYINHGMRESSQLKEDDDFARNFTNQLGVELYSHKIKSGYIENISRNEGRSSEEVARELRYSFFDEILRKYENPLLALGHNLDDQFETMVIRFFQGSGIHGLKGIPHVNDEIIRPMIDIRKHEILDFLKQHRQGYRQDPSNLQNNYLRNQVRNILIPQVEQIFPGYTTSLVSLNKKFSDMDQFFQHEADKITCEYSDTSAMISIHEFNKSHNIVRLNILYRMFDHTYKGEEKSFRVPERFFNPLLGNCLKNDSTYAIAYGIKVFTELNKLCFKTLSHENSGFYYLIDQEEVIIPGKYKITMGTEHVLRLNVVVDSPLLFRSKKDGDFILINDGKKTVKSIFAHWKIPDQLKYLIPIIEDSNGIVAILGELQGYQNIFRNKKINSSVKFNILYLEVDNIFQE